MCHGAVRMEFLRSGFSYRGTKAASAFRLLNASDNNRFLEPFLKHSTLYYCSRPFRYGMGMVLVSGKCVLLASWKSAQNWPSYKLMKIAVAHLFFTQHSLVFLARYQNPSTFHEHCAHRAPVPRSSSLQAEQNLQKRGKCTVQKKSDHIIEDCVIVHMHKGAKFRSQETLILAFPNFTCWTSQLHNFLLT